MTDTDLPICTTEAARAAGLDVPPTPDELTACAESIIRAIGHRAEPEVDLARAVPLMVNKIAAVTADRDRALAELGRVSATLTQLRAEGQAAELRGDLADAGATDAIAAVIRDFDWAYYGLAEVRYAPPEWIGDLASAIAGALPTADGDSDA